MTKIFELATIPANTTQ